MGCCGVSKNLEDSPYQKICIIHLFEEPDALNDPESMNADKPTQFNQLSYDNKLIVIFSYYPIINQKP